MLFLFSDYHQLKFHFSNTVVFVISILTLGIRGGQFESSTNNMGYLNSVLQPSSQVHAEDGPVCGGGLRLLPFLSFYPSLLRSRMSFQFVLSFLLCKLLYIHISI